MPNVSVVIPTYNRAREVVQAIDSALKQTYKDMEIIVIDDGSTDDTAQVVGRYGNAVRYIRTANAGCAAARNKGIQVARGKYVAFLDSDDTWHVQKLEAQVGAMERFGPAAGVCFTDAQAVGNPARKRSFFEENSYDPGPGVALIDDTISFVMLPRQPVLLPAMMVTRCLLEEGGGFDEALIVSQDTDLIFRLALVTRFCVVNRVLAFFDVSDTRSVSQIRVVRKDPLVRLDAEERLYLRLLDAVEGRHHTAAGEVRLRLSSVYSRRGMLCLRHSEKKLARAAFRKSLGYGPSARSCARLVLSCVWPSLLIHVSDRMSRTAACVPEAKVK